MRKPTVALVTPVLLLACTGPSLHLHNPDGHPVYVDGVQQRTATLPFRYYGTTRWDALPRDPDAEHSDFGHVPTSRLVPVQPPVSGLLFPLDFPLELLARLANGRRDTTAEVAVQKAPPETRAESELANTELDPLVARAHAARTSR
ncbi:MAG: hypothetical protein JNK15_17140 [Planctomycetes bacterium]|nr:hypothetical protein [Planctomycetota bacterium]